MHPFRLTSGREPTGPLPAGMSVLSLGVTHRLATALCVAALLWLAIAWAVG